MALAEKIRNQIEFYFSDSNFRRDAFLRAASESDPDGFVQIGVLLTFNKLKQLTTDPTVVAEALKDSTAVVLSEDKLKVKRSAELPATDDSASRTLYVKGYPPADPEFTIEAVHSQFSAYGKVLLVKLRRYNDRSLKGSAFIEFESSEAVQAANAAANVDGAVQIGFKDTPFQCVMPYSEWSERKKANLEKKRKGEKIEKKVKASVKENEEADGDGKSSDDYEHGLVVKVSNIPANLNSLAIKRFVEKLVDGFAYVEYNSGDLDAVLRFGETSLVQKFLATIEKGLSITASKAEENEYYEVLESETGNKLIAAVLEGEEEKAVWDKKKAAASSGDKRGRGGGRGRGRGGRGFKKQRR